MAGPPQTRPLESRIARHIEPLQPWGLLVLKKNVPRFNVLNLLTLLTSPRPPLRHAREQRRPRDGIDQPVLHRLLRAEFHALGEPLQHL